MHGGASGVTNAADLPLAADVTWSFTTTGPPPNARSGRADPRRDEHGESVRRVPRRDPARRGLQRVPHDRHHRGERCGRSSDYDVVLLGQMALNRGASLDVRYLRHRRRQPRRHAARQRPRVPARRHERRRDAVRRLPPGRHRDATGTRDHRIETIQFHGTADRYTTSGATTVATLFEDATTATANPAVTLRSVGANGGQAAAFTYDLPRSIVYTRQGNPAWSGQERDGTTPDPLRRPLLRRCTRGPATRLGEPVEGADPAGRRTAASAREPRAADGAGPRAVAALLVPAARREGRRGDDG